MLRPNIVYLTPPTHSCNDSPYKDIKDKATFEEKYPSSTDFLAAITGSNIVTRLQPDILYNCLNDINLTNNNNQLQNEISSIDTQITDYNNQKGLIDTYNEMNNSSLYYYKNDLKYVIFKIFFFIILILTYIYFFKLTGIIEPVKRLINTIISKGDTFINKVTEKIKNPPATNVKPTATNVITTDVKPKPTNVLATNVKPANTNPKPANTNPKPANTNPKPTNLKPKPTNSNLKSKI
jgi:hypothetical protein